MCVWCLCPCGARIDDVCAQVVCYVYLNQGHVCVWCVCTRGARTNDVCVVCVCVLHLCCVYLNNW